MARLLLLALAIAAVGCGGERPQGVQVTEAPDSASRLPGGPRASSAFDTVYADTAYVAELRADSLAAVRADSLRRDSLRQDSVARAAARPDFAVFWRGFRAAVSEGRDAVAARTAFSESLTREAFDDLLFEAAFGPGPFRDGVLALTARDFRRGGARRTAAVTVGFDADGGIVPEDEAVTESSVLLAFDVVDGAYRLVEIQLAG